MLMTDESRDHFMVGKRVKAVGDVGIVEAVREHTIEVDGGDRETHTRVIVKIEDELGSFTRNVDSSSVQVMEP